MIANPRIERNLLLVLAMTTAMALLPARSLAELKLCNPLENEVLAVIGYTDGNKWSSKGWEPVAPFSCAVLIEEPLQSRFYYLHAVERKEEGEEIGEWSGPASMCVDAVGSRFEIAGVEDCQARGYSTRRFLEVDTAGEASWIITLADKTNEYNFVATLSLTCAIPGSSEVLEYETTRRVNSCETALEHLVAEGTCTGEFARMFCEDRGHGEQCAEMQATAFRLESCEGAD